VLCGSGGQIGAVVLKEGHSATNRSDYRYSARWPRCGVVYHSVRNSADALLRCLGGMGTSIKLESDLFALFSANHEYHEPDEPKKEGDG
jgi:hypothetical protein